MDLMTVDPQGNFIPRAQSQGGSIAAPSSQVVWTFQPIDPIRGPFRRVIGGAAFNGTWDFVSYDGYNVADAGGQALAGEPAFYDALEATYNDSTKTVFERYWHFASADGAQQKRPIFVQINRATGDITSFQFRSSGLTFTDWTDDAVFGTLGRGGLSLAGHSTQTTDTGVVVTAQNGKSSFLQLGAPAGSGVIIQRVSNNWWEINTGGSVLAWTSAATGKFRVNHDIGSNATFLAQTVVAQKDGLDTITAKKVAGQTVPLMSIRDENDARYGWRIGSTGYQLISKNAAPADADLSAGDMAIWFDSTNGAGKLMVKAKTANGTVVTGNVALV